MASNVQRAEQDATCRGYIPHGGVERSLIGLRGRVEAADLAHELQRRVMQLRVGRWVIGVSQAFDVSAHGRSTSVWYAVPAGHGRRRQDHEHDEYALDEADPRERGDAPPGISVENAPQSGDVELRLQRATAGPDGTKSYTEGEQMECGQQPTDRHGVSCLENCTRT